MPLYHDLLSHVWIAYALFLNGYLATTLFGSISKNFRQLVDSFEALVLSGFFLSITLNGTLVFILTSLGLDIHSIRYLLPLSTVLLVLSIIVIHQRTQTPPFFRPECNWMRISLYLFVFIILAYNGGLIERIADSWYHLSLANKIVLFNTIDVGNHLNGVSSRFYPPLWHLNLAALNALSDISLPVFWNSFTAWGGCIKVMSFYLLALGITKRQNVAVLSALLFILLPGLGDAYMRVSAWPSHISYTAWFCMFYLTFKFLDTSPMLAPIAHKHHRIFPKRILHLLARNRALILCFVVLTLIVFFTHRIELVWYAAGLFFYSIFLTFNQLIFNNKKPFREKGQWLLQIYFLLGISGLALFTSIIYIPVITGDGSIAHLRVLLPFILFLILTLLYSGFAKPYFPNFYNRNFLKLLLFVSTVSLLVSIDSRHLLSLFKPELSYPMASPFHFPIQGRGLLGEHLALPGWHMQLRSGLLYSGLSAIFISLFLVVRNPNRATLFLASNSLLPFLIIISPYLYQWLYDVLSYVSLERIALLVFHPIILGYFICYIISEIKNEICDEAIR